MELVRDKIKLLLVLALTCGLGVGCPKEKQNPPKNDPTTPKENPPVAHDAGLSLPPSWDAGTNLSNAQDAGPEQNQPTDAGEPMQTNDAGIGTTPSIDGGIDWVDCNGEEFGTAYFDACLQCVEGNTGLLPCEPHGADGGTPFLPETDGGSISIVDAGVSLSPEAIEAAGRYLTAYRYLREAIMLGVTDTDYDLDGDSALGILDVVAGRCLAYSESSGVLFPQIQLGCPVEADVTKFRALIPSTTTDCHVDEDCLGASPGSPRCISTQAFCRCLPIGASGLSECQPTFP